MTLRDTQTQKVIDSLKREHGFTHEDIVGELVAFAEAGGTQEDLFPYMASLLEDRRQERKCA